jgi:hypothetical protein
VILGRARSAVGEGQMGGFSRPIHGPRQFFGMSGSRVHGSVLTQHPGTNGKQRVKNTEGQGQMREDTGEGQRQKHGWNKDQSINY